MSSMQPSLVANIRRTFLKRMEDALRALPPDMWCALLHSRRVLCSARAFAVTGSQHGSSQDVCRDAVRLVTQKHTGLHPVCCCLEASLIACAAVCSA